jgi:cyclopropane fatty-acyl-phospholipid synthase-like methyltransferase
LDDKFYQTEYRSGFTTNCPSDEELSSLIRSSFRGSPKDFDSRIQLLDALGIKPGQHKVLDFGASWGYGTWQFAQWGFDAIGLEISQSRTRFGRQKLGVDLRTSAEEIAEPVDVFFSSHVIEHFSQPSLAIEQARKLLKPDGLFIAYTPNGCDEFRRVNPDSYHRSWGGVHPSYLDDRYWRRMFPDAWHFFASIPVDLDCARNWNQESNCCLNLDSSELVFVAKLKPGQ